MAAEGTIRIFMIIGIIVIPVILNIALFFKIWKMTNTVEHIYNLALTKSSYMPKVISDAEGNSKTIFGEKD